MNADEPSAAAPQPHISVSRSDTLMIARRFNAGTRRMTAGLRRVATLEASEKPQASLRDALVFCGPFPRPWKRPGYHQGIATRCTSACSSSRSAKKSDDSRTDELSAFICVHLWLRLFRRQFLHFNLPYFDHRPRIVLLNRE